MNVLIAHLVRLQVTLALVLRRASASRRRDDRGDVPGWVMVTVMTAGLVMLLWGAAKPQLEAMLSSALGSVKD